MDEEQGITWVDGLISSVIKESPRYLELKIECLVQSGQKLFIALEKN